MPRHTQDLEDKINMYIYTLIHMFIRILLHSLIGPIQQPFPAAHTKEAQNTFCVTPSPDTPFPAWLLRAAGRNTSTEHLPHSGDRRRRAAPHRFPHSGRLAPYPPPRRLARSPPAALPCSQLRLPPSRSQREGAGHWQ
jgi:hypothetical protein